MTDRREMLLRSLFLLLLLGARLVDALAAHPRLVLNDAGLAALQASIASNPEHASFFATVSALGTSYLSAPLTPYPNCTVVGACRNAAVFGAGAGYLNAYGAADIIDTCALLHRLSSNSSRPTPFSDRAIAELLHVSRFVSWYWPVAQALERSIIAFGVGVGLDWLYHLLTPAQRDEIEAAIGTLVLDTRLRDEREGLWWLEDGINWSVNANAPLLGAALAVIDVPSLSARASSVVELVLKDVIPSASLFHPDGVWPEGPGYAGYTFLSLSQGCAALETSGYVSPHGTPTMCDWTPTSPLHAVCGAGLVSLTLSGPSHNVFNFADAGPGAPVTATLFRAATVCDIPSYAAVARALRRGGGGATLWDLLFFTPMGGSKDIDALPLGAVFVDPANPKTHTGAFRSTQRVYGGATDVGVWVAFKGGLNAYADSSCNNHGHLDVGSFVAEANGQRWVVDLGGDAYDYPLLAYFGRFRQSYFRISSSSHNVLSFDTDTQHRKGSGFITASNTTAGGSMWAHMDVTSAYGGATRVSRTVTLDTVADRGGCDPSTITTLDEWMHDTASVVTWTIHTPASVDVRSGGDGPILTMGASKLSLSAVAGGGGAVTWALTPIILPPPQASGYEGQPAYAVTATVAASVGSLRVTLTPMCA